ncbi:ABC transporter permease [Desulfatiglans anilini]|uniref:ABC transporter permease n=1 Tax=Desulfatiglans anilini TaxID=90728 RepID=UPI0004069885|nr:ABC transporter permease [Desulfatiglans anilini]
MQGLWAVYRKELSDHFSSYRFVILFAMIAMVSFITSYMAGVTLRENLEGIARPKFVFLMLFNTPGALFSMLQFVAFFGPLIGLVLGFDAINRERAQGTLIKVLSQPIYRDAVINGKFLAGVTVIGVMLLSIVLIISGFGITLLGIVPGVEEILRLAVFLMLSLFYVAFWLGLAILFSILFKGIATSAMASVALWIFLSFFISLGADVAAGVAAPIEGPQGQDAEAAMRHARIKELFTLTSPMVLYTDAAGTVIDPMRKTTRKMVLLGYMEQLSLSRFQNPLPLGQSLLVVFPHVTVLIAVTLICFAVSYLIFMTQEIRT